MALVVLTQSEKKRLLEMFMHLKKLGEQYPLARVEAMIALRCLKAIHSNVIEDKRVDRVFLQVLLHNSGVANKAQVSKEYEKAGHELRGQETMLKWLESQAFQRTEISISMLLEMHRMMFEDSWPEGAGQFRQSDVKIRLMSHLPPHHSKITQFLHQQFATINERLFAHKSVTEENFSIFWRFLLRHITSLPMFIPLKTAMAGLPGLWGITSCWSTDFITMSS